MAKNILVIDDENAIRRSFELSLESTPFQVTTAESGQKGIDLFNSGTYDLIFLDLKMPGLNGVQTLTELRKMNRSVPIYIITAFHGEYFSELKEAQNQGLEFELLKKPIGNEEIVMVTKSVLEDPIAA